MKSKYTPGPWKTVENSTDKSRVGIACNLGGVIIKDISGYTITEQVANAALIAAAPCMYAALNGLISVLEAEPEACGIYKTHLAQARAAISKATGGK